MQFRALGLAMAIAMVMAGQSLDVANAQIGASQELSAQAQGKKQAATRSAPQRSAPARSARTQAAKPSRAQTAKPARTHAAQPKSAPTRTAKPPRTHTAQPKSAVRTPAHQPKSTRIPGTAKSQAAPNVRSATPGQRAPGAAERKAVHRAVPGAAGAKRITRGPGAVKVKQPIARGPGAARRVVAVPPRRWNGWRRPARVVVIRDRWRFYGPYGWRTFVPFTALATLAVGSAVFYPAGYVSMPEPACAGVTADGNQLRWTEVPTEEGASEWQCVAYSPEPGRAITELNLADDPATVAAIPAPTSGMAPGPAAAAATEPAARGCELTIYAEANLRGQSALTDEDQADLGADGWKDQIASVQVKSGTWDFFTGDNYSGQMMRLGPGSYANLDSAWTRHIGSFMCSRPSGT